MKNLLATTALTALSFVFSQPALAACDNVSPGNGDTVTCDASSIETRALDDGSPNVTVNVEAGAQIVVADDDAIKLKDEGNTINNAGTIQGGDEAIVGGTRLGVYNSGRIIAADHGIVGETEDDDPAENMTIVNQAAGTIEADGDAVKSGDGLRLYNYGTMTSGDDLLQGEEADGSGADNVHVENHGTMTATDKGLTVDDGSDFFLFNATGATLTSLEDEGVEAGDDAEVINDGTITGFDDAIQVGERANIVNTGMIENTQTVEDIESYGDPQDAIDIDSGTITNTSTGVIRSVVDAAIDFDPGSSDGVIENAGLIEGTVAVETDEDVTQNILVSNWGTLRSTSEGEPNPTGLALQLRAGDDVFRNYAGEVVGGAEFGAGDDTMTLYGHYSDDFGGIGALFDGGDDEDTFNAFDYTIDMLSVAMDGSILDLSFDTGSEIFSISLVNFELFNFAGGTQNYTYDEIAGLAAAPVPLPAGLLLLATGLAGFGALRRRAA